MDLSFDPSRSRAVILGAAEYPEESALPRIPGVRKNVVDLRKLLVDSSVIGLPNDHVQECASLVKAERYSGLIQRACKNASDLILIYYSGHGFPRSSDRTDLLLTTPRSTIKDADHNALRYSALRELVQNSKAKQKIVILDCCYAGLAARTLGSQIEEQRLEITGAAVMTAASWNKPAKAWPEKRNTAFTGILLKVLKDGVRNGSSTVTLQEVFGEVLRIARSHEDLPDPELLLSGQMGQLKIAHNRYKDTTSRGTAPNAGIKPAKLGIASPPAIHTSRPPSILLVKSAIKYPIKDLDFGIPLGLWVLKSTLQMDRLDVEVWDERLEAKRGNKRSFESVMSQYDVIGVSACSSEVYPALHKLRLAKERGKTTVIGGIFCGANDRFLTSHPFVDYVIPGVATRELKHLMLELGGSPATLVTGIPGVLSRSSTARASRTTYDTIPSIDASTWDEIIKLYGPYLDGKIDTVTARGCPYPCDFCSIQKESRGYITRNDSTVVREMIQLAQSGFNRISIKDEIFPLQQARGLNILRRAQESIGKVREPIEFKIKARLDRFRGESGRRLLREFAQLGVREIQFGVETVEPIVLGLIHKGGDSGQMDEKEIQGILAETADAGIVANTSFILGNPGETEFHYRHLIRFIEGLKGDPKPKVYMNFYTPHPVGDRWNLFSGFLVTTDLNCFTHKIPVVYPATLTRRADRAAMLATYKEVVEQTGSSLYNPPVPVEFHDRLVEADRNFSGEGLSTLDE